MIPSRQLNSGKPVRVILNYRELLLVVDQRKAWEKDVQLGIWNAKNDFRSCTQAFNKAKKRDSVCKEKALRSKDKMRMRKGDVSRFFLGS